MTRTPARLHPFTGEGGLAGDSTRRVFLKGASSIVRLTPVRRGTAARGYYGTNTLGTDPGDTPGAVGR
jgi:hypothetical protein